MKRKMGEFDAGELNLITLAREYSDDEKARALIEEMRWPNGPVCPHCGCTPAYRITSAPGSSTRKGLLKCKECRKQFTVTVGTVFEDSHIGLGKWLMAIFILCSSKKAMSAHQLHRMLDITYKSAWFMAHRIRYAMGPGMPLQKLMSDVVEIDETYVGGKPGHGDDRNRQDRKTPVMALVERNGKVRTKVVSNVTVKNIQEFITPNLKPGTMIHSDQSPATHTALPLSFGYKHRVVNHSIKEYARREQDGTTTHVNTAESFFSLLKRGVYGSWHYVSREHLPKYVDEFAFRWDMRKMTDGERTHCVIQ